MANLIQIVVGMLLAGIGAYAALAGAIVAAIGSFGIAEVRVTRPIAVVLALVGLVAYVLGTLLIAGRMIGPA